MRLYILAAGLAATLATAASAQSALSKDDDFDCLAAITRTSSGMLKSTPELNAGAVKEHLDAASRINRALGFYIARNETRSRQSSFRTDLMQRFDTLGKLDLDRQTELTLGCVRRSDDAMLGLLQRAKGN